MRKAEEVHWKGAVWKAAYGSLSVKELLTTLKGFGPMETLSFEKPGCLEGKLSLCLVEDGRKEIALFHLEVKGEEKEGRGREALQWLRDIFKGEVIIVEDPENIRLESSTEESLPFWIEMFREGLVDALEGRTCVLHRGMTEEEIALVEREANRLLRSREGTLITDDSKE